MRTLPLLLLPLLISAEEITIASWNVENLFDLKKSGTEYAQYTPSYEGWNIASYQTKLENISEVIVQLKPDILALQEIENSTVLTALRQRTAGKGVSLPYQSFGELPENLGVGTAVLSRFPITKTVRHPVKISKTERSRCILETEIKTPRGPIRVLAVHWPSKHHQESARISAAKAVRSIIDTLPPACEYLILGDFNSNCDESVSLLTDSMDNTGGKTGINHILNTALSSLGRPFTPCSVQDINPASKRHFDPWFETPESERFSYRYQGQMNTLDHILLPVSLLDNANWSYKSESFGHFTMFGALLNGTSPIRWQTITTKERVIHLNRGWSDHLPVQLTLTTEKTAYRTSPGSSGSFETSNDGWIIPSSKFWGYRTGKQSAEGRMSLFVQGRDKSNGTLLKLTAVVPPNMKSARLQLAGEGEYAIRIRKAGTKKWHCVKNGTLSGSAAGTYAVLPNKKWVQRTVPLYPFKSGDTVNLEIRYRGNVMQKIYLDDCTLNGWFRLPGK